MDAGWILVAVVVIGLAGAGIWWLRRGQRTHLEDAVVGTIGSVEPAERQRLAAVQEAPAIAVTLPEVAEAEPLAVIEIVSGPEAVVNGTPAGRKINITRPKVTIGRNPRQVDIQLYNLDEPSSISRLHCTLEFYSAMGYFMITDEGSSSGTKVGGLALTPYQPTALQNGDVIELGLPNRQGATLRFHTAHNPPDVQGGRLGLQVKIEAKDTIRQSLREISGTSADRIQCDVFLSYSRADRDTMRYIRESLSVSGLMVWSDEDLEPGTKMWRTAVESAIENARCVVAVLSPEAKQSTWVGEELNYAAIHNVRVFTVLVRGDESSALPLGLTGMQWVDMRHNNYETGIEQLLKRLREYLETTGN